MRPPIPAHRLCTSHGLFLLLYLLLLQGEKLRLTHSAHPSTGGVLPVLLELGFVVAFEAMFLLLAWPWNAPTRSRWRALLRGTWLALFTAGHAAVYLLVLVEHVFFLNTGTRLDLDVLRYGLRHLSMLRDLLSGGVDHRFVWRLVLAGSCFAAGWVVGWARRRSSEHREPASTTPLRSAPAPVRLAAPLLMLGVSVVSAPLWLGISAPVTVNTLVDWVVGGLAARAARDNSAGTLAPEQLYLEPRLTSEPERRPNIVFLVLESTRADAVAPWAPPEEWSRTPALAALARRSLVFEAAHSTVTHTSKALIAILCGMYPRLGIGVSETLEGNLPLRCLPELLGELGYRSAFLQTALGEFENFPGLVRNTGFGMAAFVETLERPGFETTGYLGLDDMAMLEPAVRWAAQGGAEPFFLTLVTVTPHHPYHVPGRPRPPYSNHSKQLYLDAIAYQDRFVGALIDSFEQSALLDDTVIFVLGDHGEAFGEHSRKEHDAVLWQEGLHIPLLVLGPEWLAEPARRGGLRSQIDLLPTVLDLLGVEWLGVLPGRSLLDAGHERILASCWYTNFCIAARSGDLKLIYHFGRQPAELYDLATDPHEQHNLAREAAWDEERQELERWLLSYKASIDLFYRRHPEVDGPEDWWRADSVRTAPP